MKLTITPSPLSGCVDAIPSKSVAHRALICAALADAPTAIKNLPSSKDIEATLSSLKALGAQVDLPLLSPRIGEKSAVLDVGESGSTLRFLLSVLLAIGGDYDIIMHGRLPERPLYPLDEQLSLHGGFLKKNGCHLHITGKLVSGTYTLPGDVSSQYITGLLLALPLLEGNSEIRLTSPLESAPYIHLTQTIQKAFGVVSTFSDNTFFVAGSQSYHSPGTYTVEGDWSCGAFWLCADKLSPGVICRGLDKASFQGDKAICDILPRLPCQIDARDIPDLIPALCAVAAVTPGRTEIVHAQRLMMKESDRLAAIYDVLSSLGADIARTQDGLLLQGVDHLEGGVVDSHNDHRIAMMSAIAAIAASGCVTILGAEAVNKSYPAFWSDYRHLGGHIKEDV